MREQDRDIITEARALQRELSALARRPDRDMLARHDLLARKPPPSVSGRIHRSVRRVLAAVRMLPPWITPYPWRADLKHAAAGADARVMLIWAPGTGRDELRRSCAGFARRLAGDARFVPVLVTDVADFTHFSRLGWLVEYLPDLTGTMASYPERKAAYLAWRYRDALVLPVSAGLADDSDWTMLLSMEH